MLACLGELNWQTWAKKRTCFEGSFRLIEQEVSKVSLNHAEHQKQKDLYTTKDWITLTRCETLHPTHMTCFTTGRPASTGIFCAFPI